MAATNNKRRRGDEDIRPPKKKIRKFKKQAEYHSSSEDDDDEGPAAPIKRHFGQEGSLPSKSTIKAPTKPRSTKSVISERQERVEEKNGDGSEDDALEETMINTALNTAIPDNEDNLIDDAEGGHSLEHVELEEDDTDDTTDDEPELSSDIDSRNSGQGARARKKRNDPEAFATSISKILTTKLSTQKRIDPILSRSRTADEANKALADSRLEAKARASLRAEKKALLERGRVKDVLGLDTPGMDTGAMQEEERRLKKIAQRGVVKLFNAVRAAQVRAEEAKSQLQTDGVIGIGKREDRVTEMSKEGFLDLISRGGKQTLET